LLIGFLRENPKLDVDLNCNDAFVDLVSPGTGVALWMGLLQNSCLGSRLLGKNVQDRLSSVSKSHARDEIILYSNFNI